MDLTVKQSQVAIYSNFTSKQNKKTEEKPNRQFTDNEVKEFGKGDYVDVRI